MGRKFTNLEGQRIGRLSIACPGPSKQYPSGGTCRTWNCLCDCGNVVLVLSSSLTSKATQSCGCLLSETTAQRSTTHGGSKLPEYGVWGAMHARCYRPTADNFKNYGAKGIGVCHDWHDFSRFYADMGPRPSPSHSVERLDRQKGYEPGNCIWATPDVQARNTSRNIHVDYNGDRLCLMDYAHAVGLNPSTAYAQHHKGNLF
jgi:hypothetical protein